MGWSGETDSYITWMQAGGTSRHVIRLRRWQLAHVAERCPAGPWATTTDELVDVIAHDGWAPETRKSIRSAIRGFYKWAIVTGRIEHDPAAHLPSVRIPRGMPRPTPLVVARDALAGVDERTFLMVALALHAGLRRAEVAGVHTDDLFDDLTGRSLRVVGKGGRVRNIPLPDDLADRLDRLPRGFVFPGREDGHLSAQYVGVLLARALRGGWSGHTLRHRFATSAYAATRDLRTVQELLGHSSPATTARYTAVPDGALREAVDAVRAQVGIQLAA